MAPPGVPASAFSATGKVSGPNTAGYSKRAYVTFLAGTGDYWKGVVGLAKGLRKAKSAYPLVVAMLPDVPEDHREILRSQGCILQEIEPIYPPENQIQFAMAYYVINYSKLRIWNMEEYSKMMYLDADIQVFENIDHLFDMADGYFYAVMDCFCEKTWSHSPQYSVGYCQQCPDKVKWPGESMGSPPPLYFNAGMFVFEPSRLTYDTLLDTLRITPPTPFAEQDFLNMFFEKTYKPIPLVYNLVLAMLWRHPENVELEKVKVVHYCAAVSLLLVKITSVRPRASTLEKSIQNAVRSIEFVLVECGLHLERMQCFRPHILEIMGSKPWRYTGKEVNMDREDIKILVAKWWDIFNDESLDFKVEEGADLEGETFSRSSIMASMPEPAVSYIPAPSAA